MQNKGKLPGEDSLTLRERERERKYSNARLAAAGGEGWAGSWHIIIIYIHGLGFNFYATRESCVEKTQPSSGNSNNNEG